MKIFLTFALILTLSAAFIASMPQETPIGGHACKWSKCPYKGITIAEYQGYEACEPGSKCYTLDSLHVIYPMLEYELLEPIVEDIHARQ